MNNSLNRAGCILMFFIVIFMNGCTKQAGKITSGLTWDYEYTNQGLPLKITDPGGKATEFSYEFYPGTKEILKKVEKKTGDGIVNYLFGESGNPAGMKDKSGQVNYEYDELNRLIKVNRTDLPSISYTYNNNDQLTSMSLSNGYRIDYVYDFLGRLSVMKTPAGEFTYNYFMGDGIVERKFPNGIRSQYKFSPEGNLESIIYADKANSVLVKYSYFYNPDGLIKAFEEWTRQGEKKLSYEYDAVQRLTGFIDAYGIKTNYTYDAFGNRTETTENGSITESYIYDGLGRMLSRNDVKFEYDNSGNLLTDENGEKSFEYNSTNQIKRAGNSRFEYSGDGSLISRVSENQKTTFLNNPLTDIWQPILALEENSKEAFYIWEGKTPVAKIENGNTTFFLTDYLSSVRGIVNENGNLTQQINYSPFGIPEQTSAINNFSPGFTGLFYEPEANLFLTKARAYNPNTGRFMQIDPLHHTPSGSQKDLSLFTYCGGDPVNNLDKSGLSPQNIDYDLNQIQIQREAEIRINEQRQQLEALNAFLNQIQTDFNPWGEWVQDVIPSVYFTNLSNYYFNLNMHPASFGIDLYSNALGAFTIGATVIKNIGSAMQVMNPPKYLNDKTNNGWEGKYKKVTNNSEIAITEKLNTGADNWWDKGKIVQSRQTSLHDKYGTYNISEEYTTPATSFFERFMMHSFPLGSYYDPEATTYKSIKTTNLKYRTVTSNGETKIFSGDDPPFKRDELSSPSFSGPTSVGGICLGGAGEDFEGLGQLSGIAMDETNGKLVLISEDKGEINLPPLRVDDVVTVFRSVYQFGEAPFVSLDPDPKDPHGPVMITRHGAATDSTYVGWILFEADRIMKVYSLGEDNITKKPVETNVDGYAQVLDAQFSADAKGKNWERFWIVPSTVERNNSSNEGLTLFEVPLMVKTQKMVMINGKLENALNGKSSKGAEEFSSWFTENYDKIAEESFSLPPAESGMTKPVPVFKELQRIALITAIAEQLRDRGIAFPFWMRGYQVKPFPTPLTTPTHTVTKNNGISTLIVFGGVNLSPSTDRIVTKMSSPLANNMKPIISASVKNQTYLKPVAFAVDNKNYKTVVIPGNDTKDLGSCVLNETDLLVPVSRDFNLNLTRKFNSFISPLDKMFGKSWSLDLPFLEVQKIPKNHTGDRVEFGVSYNLISPMNSYSEKFENVYIGDNKLIGFKTRMISTSTGTYLHFNEKGFLVAYEQKPVMILYNRDQDNRITQIVGFFAEKPLADIKLEYDKEKLVAAMGSNGESVKYVYSDEGSLKQIILSKRESAGQIVSTKDIISYGYKNGLVEEIKFNEKMSRQFRYNEKGQLLSEKSAGNTNLEHNISSNESGSLVTTYITPGIKEEKKSILSWFRAKKNAGKENLQKKVAGTIQYDYSFRPVKQVAEDGTVIDWDYTGNDYDQMEVSQPSGDKYTVKQSKDGSHVSYSMPDGKNYDENYDKAGKLLSLSRNNQTLYTQEWIGSGKPYALRTENSDVYNQYDKNDVLSRTLITAGNGNTEQGWMEYKYDENGQVASVSDFSGMKTSYNYDQNGEVSSIESKQGSIAIKRNNDHVDEIETSWGSKTNYTYDPDGNILSVKNSGSGYSSLLNFTKGKLSEMIGSNGSKYSFSYNPEPDNYQIRAIKSPVNNLEYKYNADGNLFNVLCNNKYGVGYSYDEAGRMKQIRINSR